MTALPLPLTLCLILHTFWGNANASSCEESEESVETIPLNATHKQCLGMRGLGYMKFSLCQGGGITTLPEMNLHSPSTSPRDDTPSLQQRSPLESQDQLPRDVFIVHEKNSDIPAISFENNLELRVSFFSEEIEIKGTGKNRTVKMLPWHFCTDILVATLTPDILYNNLGLPLHSIDVGITWERLEGNTPAITFMPLYE